jgi:hypothetical protein
MADPWFAAYYSENTELAFQAPGWREAVEIALARASMATGALEAMELGHPADLEASRNRHPG